MEITKNIIEKMLKLFGIEEPVEAYACLVNIDYQSQGEQVIKHYMRVQVSHKNYILKILRLPMCPEVMFEKQAEISELYRKAGVSTPKTFVSLNGKYSVHFQIDKIDVIIVLEEDAGELLQTFSEEIIRKIAVLLGRMHRISLERSWSFRTGSFYREFCNGNTAYLPLWEKVGTQFLPQNLLSEVVNRYDARLDSMRKAWQSLPVAMVQGDFYRLNWTVKEGNIMVIDYDRVGDEVLLSDLLITWFRMKYDPVIRRSFPEIADKGMCNKFMESYANERMLTGDEKAAYQDVYEVIGTVYGTKYYVDLATKGKFEEAANGLYEILEMLR